MKYWDIENAAMKAGDTAEYILCDERGYLDADYEVFNHFSDWYDLRKYLKEHGDEPIEDYEYSIEITDDNTEIYTFYIY